MGEKLSKYQKFEVEVISRGEIHGADYNPRVISEDARKRLKRMLAKHGLVQPLVWNRRTGNLVSGHQRLSQLDQLERSQDYDLQVSVVDVDEREEKLLNVCYFLAVGQMIIAGNICNLLQGLFGRPMKRMLEFLHVQPGNFNGERPLAQPFSQNDSEPLHNITSAIQNVLLIYTMDCITL